MTRRIVFAIVGSVEAALLLTGAGTLLLGTVRAREITRNDLKQQVTALASGLDTLSSDAGQKPRPALLNVVARALKLDGVAVLFVNDAGKVTGQPPAGISLEQLRVDQLTAGTVVSGSEGNLAYAAASAPTTKGTAIIAATRRANVALRPAVGWFLLSSAITVLLGAVVAVTLSRRITRPLRQATAATHQIAGGDLGSRLPEPPLESEDELADLARSINTMAAGLERSQGLEQQFLLSVSHDLRTPLTSIRGYAEAIADGTATDQRRAAGVILREAERLERLVQDLLDLARLQARTFSLQRRPVDLAVVASQSSAAFLPGATARGIEVQLDAPAPVVVVGDADRLAQVVANLVQNGLKFARTRIVVSVEAAAGAARLTVQDDGPGIPVADLAHVFERLYVARHQPKAAESGSGLGLAIVRELVTAMGGTVRAASAPSGGALLAVTLPLAPASSLPPPTAPLPTGW